MADMTFTTALDDRGFNAGLRSVENQARRGAAGVERILRFSAVKQGVNAGLNFAGEAVRAYADRFESARPVLERFETAVGRVKAAIGRDLVIAMDATAPAIDGFMKRFEAGRTAVVNWYAALLGGDGAGVDAAMAAGQNADRRFAQANASDELRAEFRRLQNEISAGNPGSEPELDREARAAAIERDEAVRRLRGILQRAASAGLSVTDLGDARGMIEARYQRRIDELKSRYGDPTDAAADDKRFTERRDALAALEVQRRAGEIDLLRLKNLDYVADRQAVILEYEQRILAVKRDARLDDEDQLRIAAQLEDQRDRTLAAMRAPVANQIFGTLQSLPGFSAELLQQVFQGSSRESVPALLREQTRVLERIERKAGPAAFSP